MRLAAHQLRPFTDINGRRWSHPSVSALMTLGAPSECPEAVIRRLCRELVAEARTDGLTGPPYDPEVLASWKGIEVLPASHDIRADARIFPAEGRLRIEFTPNVSEERRRFSIFHEITHTRFPDCYEEVRHRQHGDRFDRLHAELEQLCNVGAAEMLMPADDMASRISGRMPSVELAEELRADFAASREAMLRRICDLSETPCALAVLSLRLKPKEITQTTDLPMGLAQPRPKFRVDYARYSKGFKLFLPAHKSAPDDSVVGRAGCDDFPAAVETWDIRGAGPWLIQGAELPPISDDSAPRRAALIQFAKT